MKNPDDEIMFLQDCLDNPGKYLSMIDQALQTFPSHL